jgi:hypothetical protein
MRVAAAQGTQCHSVFCSVQGADETLASSSCACRILAAGLFTVTYALHPPLIRVMAVAPALRGDTGARGCHAIGHRPTGAHPAGSRKCASNAKHYITIQYIFGLTPDLRH